MTSVPLMGPSITLTAGPFISTTGPSVPPYGPLLIRNALSTRARKKPINIDILGGTVSGTNRNRPWDKRDVSCDSAAIRIRIRIARRERPTKRQKHKPCETKARGFPPSLLVGSQESVLKVPKLWVLFCPTFLSVKIFCVFVWLN